MPIVAFHQQISLARRARRQFLVALDQAIRHFLMMPGHGIFSDPVQSWHFAVFCLPETIQGGSANGNLFSQSALL
jgi:hypothetical protein